MIAEQPVVLVTGSSGLIGSAAVRRLAATGAYRVVGFDVDQTHPPPEAAANLDVDVASEASLAAGMRTVRQIGGGRIASVIHLVAYIGLSGEPSPEYERVTLGGTRRLLAALESFDVIGGQRLRYRTIGMGDNAPRGSIDPFIGIGFKLGPKVDSSGSMPDGRPFSGIAEFQSLLAADPRRLLKNLAEQLARYSTGRDVTFGDRDAVARIVDGTLARGGGIRTLIHELIESPLFGIP